MTSTDQAAPNVKLKIRIVTASVRTAGCRTVQRSPSAISRRMPAGSRCACGGSESRSTASTPATTSAVSATNGQATPAAKSTAPSAGPAS